MMADWYSHEFNEADHIMKVHMVYGSNHIQQELLSTSGKENKNNSAVLKIVDNTSVHFYKSLWGSCFTPKATRALYPLFKYEHMRVIFLSKQSPPPKFLA